MNDSMGELLNRLGNAASIVGHDMNEVTVIALKNELEALANQFSEALTVLGERATTAEGDAASLRSALEGIRDMARRTETASGDWSDYNESMRIRDLLGSVAHRAAECLTNVTTGATLRKDLRQLEAMVDKFEAGMQEAGGWRYGYNQTLAERIQRCVDHYTRMAATAVSDAHSFKDGVVAWLRGIAINAQSVSWAATHHEKDARLRGLIEVVEGAITEINKQRLQDRLSAWNGVVDSWSKSDFPTREMRRKILDQEAEIKRLREKVGE